MKRAPLARLTIKTALLLGFGLILGLWLFAGYHFTRRMAEVETEAAAVNARYMRSQELLSTVRAQVLLGSVFVRDALLDPDPSSAGSYRRQLEETYQAVDATLQQYVPVLDSAAEQEHVAQLRREVADFRATMLDVLGGDSRRWPAEARLLLSTRVVPKRQVVIRVSDEVQALNRAAFIRQQTETTHLYQTMQNQVWVQLGLALAASFAIGLVAIRYSSRLEHQIRQQMEKEADTSRDLQRLSSTIISAQEEERRTIARELHDEVGQLLTAIKVELAVAERTIAAAAGGHRALASVRAITDGALQTVRDLSHFLHPALLDDLGLPAAVDSYLKEFGRRHGLRVQLLQDGMDGRLAAGTEAAAYRIIQEALTNVVKHAHATACRVYLQRLPNTILVTIEDDGVGFDPADAAKPGLRRGLGLIGIRERAGHLRGTVRLESASGKGTRLTVELPAPAVATPVEAIAG